MSYSLNSLKGLYIGDYYRGDSGVYQKFRPWVTCELDGGYVARCLARAWFRCLVSGLGFRVQGLGFTG